MLIPYKDIGIDKEMNCKLKGSMHFQFLLKTEDETKTKLNGVNFSTIEINIRGFLYSMEFFKEVDTEGQNHI
ncbi:hypothetical protein J27TS8_24970 [Robertmurraya siralis]|uniref:Uncharacterized protein n=1 Tax=Robertmurraya siralis TaxID=77777 RepID=A0A919WIU7_9BACI|nr:hypothetical protein J27TS8_24970 [Robertmurraya siralis]